MKRILLATLLALATTASSAQTFDRPHHASASSTSDSQGSEAGATAPYLQQHWSVAGEASTGGGLLPQWVNVTTDGFAVGFIDYLNYNSIRVSTDADLSVITTAQPPSGNPAACRTEIDAEPLPGPIPGASNQVLCRNISSDSNGTSFFVEGDLDEIVGQSLDGLRHVRALGFDARPWVAVSAARSAGGAVFAVPADAGELRLLGVDARLRVLWQRDLGEFPDGAVVRLAQQGPDIVLLRQIDAQLLIDRVAQDDGALTPQASLTLAPDRRLERATLDASGNVFVRLTNTGIGEGPSELLRVDATGSISLRVEMYCDMGLTSDQPIASPLCEPVSRGPFTHWLAYDAGITRLYKAAGSDDAIERWASGDFVRSMALSDNGSSLLVVEDGSGGLASTQRLVLVEATPDQVHDPASVTPLPESANAPTPVLLDDGLLVEDLQDQTGVLLRRFDADGQLLWRQPLGANRKLGDVSGTQACVSNGHRTPLGTPVQATVECYRLDNGAPTLGAVIADVQLSSEDLLATEQPGRALALVRPNGGASGTRLVELRANTAPRTLAEGYRSPLAVLDHHDQLVVIDRRQGEPIRIDRFDADGNNVASLSLPAAVVSLHSAMFDPLDRLWISFTGSDPQSTLLARINAQGAFADGAPAQVFGQRIMDIATSGDGVIVRTNRSEYPVPSDLPNSALQSIDTQGRLRWQYATGPAMSTLLDTRVEADRIRALEFVHFAAQQWRLIELDPSSGNVRNAWALPGPDEINDGMTQAQLRDADTAVFAGRTADQRVLVGDIGLAASAAIAEAAPALTGVWMIPGLGGQGFVFEHNAAAGVLSAAWYSHDGAEACCDYAHSALRWNTLAGQIVQGDSVTQTLSIYENHGGVFDDAPATTAIAVGQATVSMVDCDHATLSYRFDDGRVVPRTVALLRASPRTSPCSLRIPGTPGTTTTPPAYTPTSDLGGAWFEPRTSGQGLHIAIYPPGSAGATETVGLGWFTYDPAGAADESTQQHWFTASGSFDDASEQRAALTLYRTTGGDRDTTATQNTHRVGEATLERIDCDSATLSYRFDDTLIANSFALRTRVIPLQRLGGCRP